MKALAVGLVILLLACPAYASDDQTVVQLVDQSIDAFKTKGKDQSLKLIGATMGRRYLQRPLTVRRDILVDGDVVLSYQSIHVIDGIDLKFHNLTGRGETPCGNEGAEDNHYRKRKSQFHFHFPPLESSGSA